jgi:hypothetical protein
MGNFGSISATASFRFQKLAAFVEHLKVLKI